ncbi:arylsulfatase, partial [Mariniblastus sp.]|nr:arylsulfatase [Mariniblastus sp.]
LYNLAKDPREQDNLYRQQPDVAKKLLDQLVNDVESGRSVEGAPSKNDVDKINLWKSKRANPGKTKKNSGD